MFGAHGASVGVKHHHGSAGLDVLGWLWVLTFRGVVPVSSRQFVVKSCKFVFQSDDSAIFSIFFFFFAISLGAFVCVYCVDSSIFGNAESVVVSICRLLLFLIVFLRLSHFEFFLHLLRARVSCM